VHMPPTPPPPRPSRAVPAPPVPYAFPHACEGIAVSREPNAGVYERCPRDLHHRLAVPSAFLWRRGAFHPRMRSELPQYQTHRCCVQVVVLGTWANGPVFWAYNHGTCAGASPTRPRHRTLLLCTPF
jgi:hypothetical protein